MPNLTLRKQVAEARGWTQAEDGSWWSDAGLEKTADEGWHPESDIAAAWGLWSLLGEAEGGWEMHSNGDESWRVENAWEGIACKGTAPEAICRAYLAWKASSP